MLYVFYLLIRPASASVFTVATPGRIKLLLMRGDVTVKLSFPDANP